MEMKMVLLIVSLSLFHWMLVPWALSELVERQRVLGGRKRLWALTIVFLTYFGPLFYLALHPQPQAQGEYEEVRK